MSLKRPILALLALILTSGEWASAAPSEGTSFPSSAHRVRNWAPESMGSDHTVSRSEAVAHARRFDVITAAQGTYRQYVSDMVAANPDLVILGYMNGTLAQKNQGTAFPEHLYLRDAQGNKVRSRGYGNFLMNSRSSWWIDNREDMCRNLLAATHYHGCFVDMLGTAPLEPGYLTGLPIDPATGRVWTKRDWLNSNSNLAAAIKSSVSPRMVVGNGLGSGPRYFASGEPSEVLLDGTDGGGAEAWLRFVRQGINKFRSEADWREDVDMLADSAARGDSVLALTKVWVSGTTAQKNAWHKFALASFLLGDNGTGYFHFSYSSSDSPIGDHPWWNVDIGSPLGSYAGTSGLYVRAYSQGKVVVNPTDTRRSISLGRSYVDLAGHRLSSITMAPHTGEVLTEA